MNGEPSDADLMALVDRVGGLYGVSGGELEVMRATALANPADAWQTLSADAEAMERA